MEIFPIYIVSLYRMSDKDLKKKDPNKWCGFQRLRRVIDDFRRVFEDFHIHERGPGSRSTTPRHSLRQSYSILTWQGYRSLTILYHIRVDLVSAIGNIPAESVVVLKSIANSFANRTLRKNFRYLWDKPCFKVLKDWQATKLRINFQEKRTGFTGCLRFYYDTADCIYQSYLVGKPL